MRGLGSYDLDRDGRYIQADFEHVSVVSLLPPSPTAELRRIARYLLDTGDVDAENPKKTTSFYLLR